MDRQMLQELSELQRYAGALGSMLDSAKEAAPASASGADSSRRVTVDIDSQGRPTSVTIDATWESVLTPETVGPAVLEAYQQAVSLHMAEWSESLERTGLKFDMRDFDAKRRSEPAPEPTPEPAPNPFVKPETGTGRDVGTMTTDLMRLLDTAHLRATEPATAPAPPTEPDTTAHVTVSLQHGQLTGVRVDPEWAQGESGSAIASEISSAIARERQREVEVEDAGPTGSRDPLIADADSLLSDVFRHLTHPTTGE